MLVAGWSRSLLALGLCSGLAWSLTACARPPSEPATRSPRHTSDPEPGGSTDPSAASFEGAEHWETPERWEIDGTTIAEDPTLPQALGSALRAEGVSLDAIQDRVVVDLNDDGELDAVVLAPAAAVAGAYDLMVVLTGAGAASGGGVRVHHLGDLVHEPSFSAAVLPLDEGPTLIGLAPRLGSCERGPSWTFLRPTGALLEVVGRIAVEDFDCAVADASIEFVRGAEGRLESVEVRHGDTIVVQRWDPSLGSFSPVP